LTKIQFVPRETEIILERDYLLKNTTKTEISAGETPLILLACPRVAGLILESFSRASKDSEGSA
jgi:hypothetical protein